ncbi:uncharacterized protein LOC132559715 isoform X2 [Ylistrum balloti]|nr:uncharacterized protein LOC132559715 isoform X2 [Ylistrum balloti]
MSRRNPRLSAHVHGLKKAQGRQADVAPFLQTNLEEPLSEVLWNSPDAVACRNLALSTCFVEGIKNGNLNPTAFGGYMVQDSVYCCKAKYSIDAAICRAPDGDVKTYLEKESESYEGYYEELFTKWHIDDPTGISLSQACQSYADFEHLVASTEDTIYMIVAMIPCMKLWPWLGKQLEQGDHGVYNEWYQNNFDPTYDGYKVLDAFVDDAAAQGTIDDVKAMEVFSRCMQGEYEFFNSANI